MQTILSMESKCTSTFYEDNFGFTRFVHRVGSTFDLCLQSAERGNLHEL